MRPALGARSAAWRSAAEHKTLIHVALARKGGEWATLVVVPAAAFPGVHSRLFPVQTRAQHCSCPGMDALPSNKASVAVPVQYHWRSELDCAGVVQAVRGTALRAGWRASSGQEYCQGPVRLVSSAAAPLACLLAEYPPAVRSLQPEGTGALLLQHICCCQGSSSKHGGGLFQHCLTDAAGTIIPVQLLVEYQPQDVDRFIEVADAIEEAFPGLVVDGVEVRTACLPRHASCYLCNVVIHKVIRWQRSGECMPAQTFSVPF